MPWNYDDTRINGRLLPGTALLYTHYQSTFSIHRRRWDVASRMKIITNKTRRRGSIGNRVESTHARASIGYRRSMQTIGSDRAKRGRSHPPPLSLRLYSATGGNERRIEKRGKTSSLFWRRKSQMVFEQSARAAGRLSDSPRQVGEALGIRVHPPEKERLSPRGVYILP